MRPVDPAPRRQYVSGERLVDPAVQRSPAAGANQIRAGDQQPAAGDVARIPLGEPATAAKGDVPAGEIDHLRSLADQQRARVAVREHEIQQVLRVVAVVVVHLGEKFAARERNGRRERLAERPLRPDAQHAHRKPRARRRHVPEPVPVQGQHQFEPGVVLARHRAHGRAEAFRPPGREQYGDARPAVRAPRVVPVRQAAHADARRLAPVRVAERNAGRHEVVEFRAERLGERRVAVEHMHRHTPRREPREGVGAFGRAGMESRDVLHVVGVAQRIGIVRGHRAARPGARRQQPRRTECEHPVLHVRRPANRVVPARVHGADRRPAGSCRPPAARFGPRPGAHVCAPRRTRGLHGTGRRTRRLERDGLPVPSPEQRPAHAPAEPGKPARGRARPPHVPRLGAQLHQAGPERRPRRAAHASFSVVAATCSTNHR